VKGDAHRQGSSQSLSLYIGRAYGFTWLCWLPALLISHARGYPLPTLDRLSAGGPLAGPGLAGAGLAAAFALGVYGPLLGALVARARASGRAGVGELWRRMIRWRVSPRWYAIAAGLALAFALVPASLARLAGLTQGPLLRGGWLRLLPLALVWQFLTSGLGEEPGWRGYLWPYLRSRMPSGRAVWTLGVAWAVWHYPLTVFYAVTAMGEASPLQAAVTVALSLVGQTLSLVGMTHLYVWLYERTGSLFLAMFLHAVSNVAPWLLMIQALPSLGVVMAAMPWVAVFILERVLGRERFPVVEAGPDAA